MHTHTKALEAFGAFKRYVRAEVLTWRPKDIDKSVPKNVDYNLVGFLRSSVGAQLPHGPESASKPSMVNRYRYNRSKGTFSSMLYSVKHYSISTATLKKRSFKDTGSLGSRIQIYLYCRKDHCRRKK